MDTSMDQKGKVRDPVCGMRFRPEKAAGVMEYRGQTIHFCTDACRRQFEQDPERYVANTASHGE